MARDFAKPFYKSKEWQNVREYILRRDNYMCTKCSSSYPLEVHHIIHLTPDNIGDVSITLNEKNLTTLCRDCHFDEHKADKAEGHRKKIPDENDYIFDENGYLVRKSPPKI